MVEQPLRSRPRRVTNALGLVAAVLLVVGTTACSSSGSTGGSADATSFTCKTKPVDISMPGGPYPPTETTGVVTVHGDALPQLPASGDDPAVGCAAPVIDGQDFAGNPVRIGGAGIGQSPTVVIAAAHWCPHCNNELPKLQAKFKGGSAGMRYVVVSTGVAKGQPHYPPGPWLSKDMGWTGGAIADDAQSTAGKALGVSAFPMFILIDSQGEVVERFSGETGPDEVLKKADNLAAVSLAGGLHARNGS
jgi:hypothetical protein